MVYVQNDDGMPIMPCTEAKARHLLEEKKASLISLTPYVIRLKFHVEAKNQPITLGLDPGYSYIGLSATTPEKVLFEAVGINRSNLVTLMSERKQFRINRRSRLRYRPVRSNNRKHSLPKGWIAPSIRALINNHVQLIKKVCSILPISQINVEAARFDIQRIKNPSISGRDYLEGPMSDFYNTRFYVLARDNYTCVACNKKSANQKLHVHHIVSRKTGGDRPDNLITLCSSCHKKIHKGTLNFVPEIKKGFAPQACMDTMRFKLVEKIKRLYPGIVQITYGSNTTSLREENNLPKAHMVDARCIAGAPNAEPDEDNRYLFKKNRCHNRKLYRTKMIKGGRRVRAQSPTKTVFGFKRFDFVKYENKLTYIHAKTTDGYFDIRNLRGERIKIASYKKISLVKHAESFLCGKISEII